MAILFLKMGVICVGHYAGSPLPGEGGNVVLDGHRDTVFRNLGNVKIGDVINVKTTYGTYNYKAANIRIVNEDDRTVLVRSSKEMLTLVALQLSLFTKMKLLNSDFYISIFQKNNLYSYTKQSTENKLLNLVRVVNLPKDIFQGLVTDEWVKQEINTSTKQTIEYMTYKDDKLPIVNTKQIADNFNSNLDNYIKSQSLKVDKNIEKELTKIKADAGNIFKNETSIIDMKLLEKNSSFQKTRQLLSYLNNSLLLITIALLGLIIMLYIANIKSIISFFSWIGYALIAGGLVTLIPSSNGLLSGFINNIAVGDHLLKKIILDITNLYLYFFIINSTIIVLF